MGHNAAIERRDHGNAHIVTDVAASVGHVQALAHVDQSAERTHHAEGRGQGRALLIHGRAGVVPGGHLLNIVGQNLPHPVGVAAIHQEHDRLLEEGVGFLRRHAFQGEQAVLSGLVGDLGQLVDIGLGLKFLGIQYDAEMLGKAFQCGEGNAGHQNADGTSHNDHRAGAVHKVHQLGHIQLREAQHSQEDEDDGQNQSDKIENIHILYRLIRNLIIR